MLKREYLLLECQSGKEGALVICVTQCSDWWLKCQSVKKGVFVVGVSEWQRGSVVDLCDTVFH